MGWSLLSFGTNIGIYAHLGYRNIVMLLCLCWSYSLPSVYSKRITIMHKATQILTALIVLLGLISLFSLCLSTFSSMKADKMGQMTSCGMVHTSAVCPIAVAQHLDFWQYILVTTSPTALFLALILTAAAFALKWGTDTLQDIAAKVIYRIWRLFKPPLLLIDYLKQAFSQGILHPKIY
jgi:hypothetical protein